VALHFFEGRCAGQHDGENILFPDAAGYELRVLRAKIKDDYGLVGAGLGFHG
jgi:hypothetical protein